MSQGPHASPVVRGVLSFLSLGTLRPHLPEAALCGLDARAAMPVALIVTRDPWWLPAALVCGYGFAWIGHFVFEKNQPASFKQPLYSFMGDWVMYWQLLTGKIPFQPASRT